LTCVKAVRRGRRYLRAITDEGVKMRIIDLVLKILVQPASAHCDTEDGPTVTDGRRALASGNINYALKWVSAQAEPEVRQAFARAAAAQVRDNGERAARDFLETLVRIHRAGEGASFEAIKPAGTDLPPQVVAADAALEAGSIAPLRGLVPQQRWDELERRFDHALALKDYDANDLPAARRYIAAYVSFFKYAEGEEHDHACAAGHHQ
jgi:hypothetical protein